MLRSFDYAGSAALIRRGSIANAEKGVASERDAITKWRRETSARFMSTYRETVADCAALPQAEEAFVAALDAFVIEKALYEICYEAANRPDWLSIPLAGVHRLLETVRTPPSVAAGG